MVKHKISPSKEKEAKEIDILSVIAQNYLFKGISREILGNILGESRPIIEKLYSNRPIYTAFRPHVMLSSLYLLVSGGPVITRSTPLDRIIALNYRGGCFGMRNLPVGYGKSARAFPSLVEAYKTTEVIQIPVGIIDHFYEHNPEFQKRYDLLFELREKFQYHLLNCSTYPPQAVASLFRGLIYQERTLENQPNEEGKYCFDLPIEVIAKASQLNNRTVEQVLKGMQQVGLIEMAKTGDNSEDLISILDTERLKEVYSATREKVSWWPLK